MTNQECNETYILAWLVPIKRKYKMEKKLQQKGGYYIGYDGVSKFMQLFEITIIFAIGIQVDGRRRRASTFEFPS